MFAILTDKNGKSLLGSDGHIWVDGRYGKARTIQKVLEYRKRFEKNFPHKFEFWTHFGIVSTLRVDPASVTPID